MRGEFGCDRILACFLEQDLKFESFGNLGLIYTLTSTHTLGVTGTSASLSREPFSIWPWHPGSTGGYLYDVSIFWAILVDFSSVQQFRYLCKTHL